MNLGDVGNKSHNPENTKLELASGMEYRPGLIYSKNIEAMNNILKDKLTNENMFENLNPQNILSFGEPIIGSKNNIDITLSNFDEQINSLDNAIQFMKIKLERDSKNKLELTQKSDLSEFTKCHEHENLNEVDNLNSQKLENNINHDYHRNFNPDNRKIKSNFKSSNHKSKSINKKLHQGKRLNEKGVK